MVLQNLKKMAADQLLFAEFLNLRKPREVLERANPFESYDEEQFRQRFRLKKTTVSLLLSEVSPIMIDNLQ